MKHLYALQNKLFAAIAIQFENETLTISGCSGPLLKTPSSASNALNAGEFTRWRSLHSHAHIHKVAQLERPRLTFTS